MWSFLLSFISSTLAGLVPFLFSKEKTQVNEVEQTGGKQNTGINYGAVQNTSNYYSNPASALIEYKFKNAENGYIKKNAHILFVDDQDQTSTIKNLQKLGWYHAKQLEQKNIQNTDCEEYKNADLIFVDFDGIGPTKRGQGLSVLSTLRSNYGRKKYYLLHTAHLPKITLQKLQENGLSIQDAVGWSQLTKGSPDYLLETTMLNGLKQIEK